jgi:hypothetical protein
VVTILQPVKPGLSAPVVTSIPVNWSAAWFRSFITNYLQNADIRNATTGGAVSVTSTNFTQPASIDLTPIPEGTVLGSIEPGVNPPQALTQAQLTSLINLFSRTAPGAVPAAPDQNPDLFLNAVGQFVTVPLPDLTQTSLTSFIASLEDADDVFSWPPGTPAVAGGGGSWSISDGTHTVAGVTSLVVTGGTVGGTTPNATLTITGGGSSPVTTKGDIYGYSTAPARIPVGTNGQVLTADSTNALGVSWQAGGGGGQLNTYGAFTTPPTTGWTTFFPGTGLSITNSGGFINMNIPPSYAGGSGRNTLYMQPLPATGDFTLTVFLTFEGVLNGGIPPCVYDSVNDKIQSWGHYGGGSSIAQVASLNLGPGGSYVSTAWGVNGLPGTFQATGPSRIWYKVQRVGAAVSLYTSLDGVLFLLAGSDSGNYVASGNYIGFILYDSDGFSENCFSWNLTQP